MRIFFDRIAILPIAVLLFFTACNEKNEWSNLGFDNNPEVCELSDTLFSSFGNDEVLGYPELMVANDSALVFVDVYEGQHFSLTNIDSFNQVKRFGDIGNGPNELYLGNTFGVFGDGLFVYNDEIKRLYSANLDSLSNCRRYTLIPLTDVDIPGAQVSKIACINDTTFFAVGTYNDKFHYFAFDINGNVISYQLPIYNFDDGELNTYHKFLSNQGRLAKHPDKSKYVATTDYSCDIDFLDFDGKNITLIKSNHIRHPQMIPMSVGGMNRMVPSKNEPIGFIDVAASDNFVFALYSFHTLMEGSYWSDTILVYDWNGTPKKILKLPFKAYAISANKDLIFLVTTNKTEGYTIVKANISDVI